MIRKRNQEHSFCPLSRLVRLHSILWKLPMVSVEKILGGAATYFSLSASYFTDVRVIAVVGEDFTPENEAVMKKRGVDTRGIQHAKGKTFHWTGEYGENVNEAKTLNTELNVFESFQPPSRPNITIPISCSWPTSIQYCKPRFATLCLR